MTGESFVRRSARWIILLINAAFWLTLLIILISSVGPYNTTSYKFLTAKEGFDLGGFLPEGFGYFTRNPEEAVPMLYQQVNGSLKLVTVPNGSPSNLFGLQRTQRALFTEIGSVLNAISSEEWSKCATNFEDCVYSKSIKVFEIKNHKNDALLCGTYFIKTRRPIPWAWRKSFKGEMPLSFVKVIVTCD